MIGRFITDGTGGVTETSSIASFVTEGVEETSSSVVRTAVPGGVGESETSLIVTLPTVEAGVYLQTNFIIEVVY